MSIAPADTTVAAIRRKIRRLTASSGNSTLTTESIDQYINQAYITDFAYGIKLDQMRSVYTFYTEPYVDRYALDVNYSQGVRSPLYIDGIQGSFFKDRQQFYNMWPRWPTRSTQSPQILSKNITGATALNPCRVNSSNHGLSTGAVIYITGVLGMTQLNDNYYTITVETSNTFTLDGVDGTSFSPYTGGGTWTSTSQTFSFSVAAIPFLRNNVTLGGVSGTGQAINICDDGNGNLLYTFPNPVVSVPNVPPNPPVSPVVSSTAIPGMINRNTNNPGLQNTSVIGTVNYVSGQFDFTLPPGVALAEGSELRISVSQYQPGLPFSMLMWNNEFIIRPISRYVHKVEIEVYLTPVQFLETTDSPILSQWWEYIALLAAMKILEDRQDMDGRDNLMPILQRQEALVLERQGIEEIGQRNSTIYTSTIQSQGWNNGWGQGWL